MGISFSKKFCGKSPFKKDKPAWPGFKKGDKPKFDEKFKKQIIESENRYNLA